VSDANVLLSLIEFLKCLTAEVPHLLSLTLSVRVAAPQAITVVHTPREAAAGIAPAQANTYRITQALTFAQATNMAMAVAGLLVGDTPVHFMWLPSQLLTYAACLETLNDYLRNLLHNYNAASPLASVRIIETVDVPRRRAGKARMLRP
jgi:hypothetical protein